MYHRESYMTVKGHELPLHFAIAHLDGKPALTQEVEGLASLHIAYCDSLDVPARRAASVVVPELYLLTMMIECVEKDES